VLLATGAVQRALGHEQHAGNSLVDLYAGNPTAIEHFRRALGGESQRALVSVGNVMLDTQWTPLRGALGSVTGLVVVAIDATEQVHRMAEAQHERATAEQLAQLQSDYIAASSHVLRTPLTAIVGFAELLAGRWTQLADADRQYSVARIVRAANRQNRMVEDLLLVTSVRPTQLAVSVAPVACAALIKEASDEVRGIDPRHQIIREGPSSLMVLADPGRGVQIIANLLDNAFKFSAQGAPTRVTWASEGMMATIRVQDNGPGISVEGRERLFTRFGRLPGTKVFRGRVGLGVGLYLARHLAQGMGGNLDLESTGPGGSVFRLQIPLAPER